MTWWNASPKGLIEQEAWKLYALSELTDKTGSNIGNVKYALRLLRAPTQLTLEELSKLIDDFIQVRWINLKSSEFPDARQAVSMSQHTFSLLRGKDPEQHKRWKALRDAKSKYASNRWRDIKHEPNRLEQLTKEGDAGLVLDVPRLRQKLRQISDEVDAARNLQLSKYLDALVLQSHS